MVELFVSLIADAITKPANDFLENVLFKNPDFYEVDEDGKQLLNNFGSFVYAYFLSLGIMGSVKALNNVLEDEEFIKELETKYNIKIKK